jgi:hypothetical protein
MSSFIDRCLRGEALLEEIDDYVDAWHEGDSDKELHAYLGMTQKEYALWVSRPDVLPFIITARHSNRKLEEVLRQSQALPLAARSGSEGAMLELIEWLQREKLWED